MAIRLSKEQVICNFIKKHDNKYDYSLVNYKNTYTKVKIICPIHGEFEQTPKNHFKCGCKQCYFSKKTCSLLEFVERSKIIHNNFYDYSKVEFKSLKDLVKIICPIHGEFEQYANSHIKGHRCANCYFDSKKKSEFVSNCSLVHNYKYDYSLVNYINNKTKVKIICPIHGEFESYPNTHLNSKLGCKKCYFDSRVSTDDFIKNAIKIHGNKYDYSESEYYNSNTKVKIICPKHGEFYQISGNHISNGQNCPNCQESSFENRICDIISLDFVKNQKIIHPKELDIYIPSHKLAIECNGNYWHSELNGKDKNYHLDKTKECEKKGIQLLHIFESEWLQKENIIKSIINSKLGLNTKIYARKCEIKEVEAKIKNSFLNENHLQGEDKSPIKLGLYYNNELVSVMTFCNSRFNKNYEWELSRFASKLNTTIIGGASKLMCFFIKSYNPKSIISYANRRHSNGNLYKQLGFTFSHYSNPNYFYFYKNKKYNLLSRQQFQKHKLKDKLEIFDSNLSEWENMKLNGYDRIWDCGNSVWVLNL